MEIEKIDDNTIKVIQTVEQEVPYANLVGQKQQLENNLANLEIEYTNQKNDILTQLSKVNEIMTRATELGVETPAAEETPAE